MRAETDMLRDRLLIGAAVLVFAASCGSSELSVTEYVDEVNGIVNRAAQQYEAIVSDQNGAVLVARGARLADFEPQDLHEALQHVRAIEAELDEAISKIDPPDQIADLHYLVFDFDDGFIEAQEALAAEAEAVRSWEELSASPEMAAYRVALAKDKQECTDTEDRLNEIAERREVFADTPWVPGDLKEIFQAVLGCFGYPEHPDDVFRP
jgi:hypothetical protein